MHREEQNFRVRYVVRNGRLDGRNLGFVAIEGERIVAVGEEADAARWIRPGDRVCDAEGRWILPAWTDSHIHVQSLAEERQRVDLHGIADVAALGAALREAAQRTAEGWLIGAGWDETRLGALPDRAVLDRFVADRPVLLWRRCLHIAAVNSRALEITGVAGMVDPPGGRIDRTADGSPTGILRETATRLVAAQIPRPSSAARRAAVEDTLEELARMGICAVSTNDAGSEDDPLGPWRMYDAIFAGDEGDRAPLPEVFWDPPVGALDAVRAAGLRSYRGVRDAEASPGARRAALHVGAVKFITDGSLGGRTAYMLHPYATEGGERAAGQERGLLRFSPAELREGVRACSEAGLRVCLHAIGDAAARAVLDALAAVAAHVPVARPRIIHSQFVQEEDRLRYRQLGAIADIQPLFAVSDFALRERVPEAFPHGYAWRRFLADGVRVSMGSDAPVESPNPVLGVRAARFRGGLHPEVEGWDAERLDLGTALRLYSEGGAFAQWAEEERGRLEPGQRADLIVVDPKMFDVDAITPERAYVDAPDLRPYVTVLRGRPVQTDAFAAARWPSLTRG